MAFRSKKLKSAASFSSSTSITQAISNSVAKAIQSSKELDAEREYLIQRAPNAIEWITRPGYLNQPTLYQHWGQYRMVKDFFELRCPNCNSGSSDPWGKSRAELDDEVLLVWKPGIEDDACPRCGDARSQFIEDGLFHGYHTLHQLVGMRAGKSAALALVGTYVEHVLLAIGHSLPGGIQEYLGTQPGDQFEITFVASTDTQSQDTIWAKYRGFRGLSPWFQRYVPWIKSQEKLQKTPEGMQRWEYIESDKVIRNGLLRIKINSLNSNSSGLVGRTRLGAFIDEISRMKQTDSSMSASEVYRGLENSCETVRTRVEMFGCLPWLGIVGSISSPISIDDKGMELLRVAERVPKMYAGHHATWEFNPMMPREALEDAFIKDPIGAERDFGARPPTAAHPLIADPMQFRERVVDATLVPTAEFEHYDHEDATGHRYQAAKLKRADLVLGGAPRYIAVDAGRNFDAFAAACAHGEQGPDGNIVTVYDWVLRIVPKQGDEVWFDSLFEIVRDLTRYVIVGGVELDQWNSAHTTQKLRQFVRADDGVETKGEHFIQFMRAAMGGRVRMLPEQELDARVEPVMKSAQGAALYELERLERDPITDKVYNPNKGKVRGKNSDDTARVVVHVNRMVQMQGYSKKHNDQGLEARRARAHAASLEWSSQQRGQVFNPGRMAGGRGRGW